MHLRKNIEGKSIIWFQNSNEYLVFESKTADIIENILEGESLEKIGQGVADDLDVPYEKAIDFVINIDENIVKKQCTKKDEAVLSYQHQKFEKNYTFKKYYEINDKVFLIEYESEFEEDLIHPKFAYLETKSKKTADLHLQIFTNHGHTFLLKNGNYFNDWSRKEIHYMQGKVSMLLVEEIYEKDESQWMGVFHASALSNGKKSILFLGDSGHGKSTSLALLQGQKFDCIADDFVPVSNEKKIHPFPSAISVKHTSWDMLANYYPNLNSEKDYHFVSLNKKVKYLPPTEQNFNHIFDCDTLIFIRYYKDIDTLFSPMTHLEAFQRLLPDSWISPIQENVSSFLDWFSNMKCYSLTYSNNQEMFEIVEKVFNDDL